MSTLVEVYGSLLNSEQRTKVLRKGGTMEKVGTVERRGWKLSFDKKSKCWNQAVLNFVRTKNSEDIYFTTIYRVDDSAYELLMEREMGKRTMKKWKRGEEIAPSSYRPIKLNSELGITHIFVIPEEGRRTTRTTFEASYVRVVRKGIEENYCGIQREINLQVLQRAVEESQITSSCQ